MSELLNILNELNRRKSPAQFLQSPHTISDLTDALAQAVMRQRADLEKPGKSEEIDYASAASYTAMLGRKSKAGNRIDKLITDYGKQSGEEAKLWDRLGELTDVLFIRAAVETHHPQLGDKIATDMRLHIKKTQEELCEHLGKAIGAMEPDAGNAEWRAGLLITDYTRQMSDLYRQDLEGRGR